MRRRTILFGLGLFWGCVLVVPPAASQKPASVSLGDVSSLPNSQVSVPLYFTPPSSPDVSVGRLRATIRFENQAVTFLKADKGIILESMLGRLEVKQEGDSENPQGAILRVEISSDGKEHLREGILALLMFSINEDAPAGTKVALQLRDLKADSLDSPTQAIEPLAAKDGSIQVIRPEETPYVSCFFFTH